MSLRSTLCAVTALLTISASAALASTITLASYGTTGPAPIGVSNTSVTFGASGTTYNIPANSPWAPPVGNSSWVSYNPNTFVGGSVIAPNGTYQYFTSFNLGSGVSTGSLTVMADDTTNVILNGTLVQTFGTAGGFPQCAVGQPNCITPLTFTLPSGLFLTGVNTLEFDVIQGNLASTGLDFYGTVSTTPEPDSLVLMGTGLIGAAKLLIARRRLA